MKIRHNDLLGRSAYVVLLLVWTRLNIESVRLHTSTLLLRWFLGFSSCIQMELSEQRENFYKWRAKKSAKYGTGQKSASSFFKLQPPLQPKEFEKILITSIKLILFSVKTVWSGFILIIAQDFRADLLYRGNFNPGITWIEAARSRHVYRKIESSAHEQYIYPLSSCWPGSPELVAYESGCKENFHCMWAASKNKPIYNLFIWLFLHTNLLLIYLFAGPLLCTCIFQWCKDFLPKLGRSTTFPV